MAVNASYFRRSELKCTLAEMKTYGAVIPYDGEAVYVLQDDGRYAVKMGDGKTPLADLPYSVNYSELEELKAAAEAAKSLAQTAQEAAEAARQGAEQAVASLDLGLSVIDGKIHITFEEG